MSRRAESDETRATARPGREDGDRPDPPDPPDQPGRGGRPDRDDRDDRDDRGRTADADARPDQPGADAAAEPVRTEEAHITAARTGRALTTSALHAAATGADTFPAVLREALGRRGLSLERVSERLKARGITISQATLSSWQRGRSQPERARSLRAVDVLEEILDLPAGTLRSLLGPRRPRGRTTPPGAEGAALQILGRTRWWRRRSARGSATSTRRRVR